MTTTAPGRDTGSGVLLPLDQLVPDHWPNPRGPVDTTSDKFTELVASIREQGILEPILVGAPLLELDGKHAIVAGWRRWTAARELGLPGVPVHQRIDITDARAALLAALAENMAREDMTPVAEAAALARLIELGMKQVEAARAVGVSERTARSRLKLLKLPKTVQAAVERGDVPTTCTEQLQLIADASGPAATAIVRKIAAGDVRALDLNNQDLLHDVLNGLAGDVAIRRLGYGPWKNLGLAPAVLKDLKQRAAKVTQGFADNNYLQLSEGLVGKKVLAEAEAAGKVLRLEPRPGAHVTYICGAEWIERAATAAVETMERRAARDAAAAAARKAADKKAGDEDPAIVAQRARDAVAKALDKRARPHAEAMNDEIGRRLRNLTSVSMDEPEVSALIIELIHRSPHLPGVSEDVAKHIPAAELPKDWATLPRAGAVAALVRLAVAATYCDERAHGKPLGSASRYPLRVPVPVVFAVAAKLELLPDRALALAAAVQNLNAQTEHHNGRGRRRRILFELTKAPKGTLTRDALRGRADTWGRDAGDLVDVAMQVYDHQFDSALEQLLQDGDVQATGEKRTITPQGRKTLQTVPGPPPIIDDIDAGDQPDDELAVAAVNVGLRGGTREQQILELLAAKPGSTIPELAAAMGVKQNTLYRVLPTLQEGNFVRKDGRGWYPVTEAEALADVGAEAVPDDTAPAGVVIVHVRPTHGDGEPVEAELQPDPPKGKSNSRKVIYTSSRIAAWVASSRIVDLPKSVAA